MDALREADEATLLRADYVIALRELQDARRVYDEMPPGRVEDPRSILRHDMAACRLQAAENQVRALIHDARAMGIDLSPPPAVPGTRPWEWMAGCAIVAGVCCLLAVVGLGHGWPRWASAGLLLVLGGAALVVGEMVRL